jgi:hypothetical protein
LKTLPNPNPYVITQYLIDCLLNIPNVFAAITRSTRHFPPTHYKLKIESYSLLSEIGLEKYESGVFEAGGHKWYVGPNALPSELFVILKYKCLLHQVRCLLLQEIVSLSKRKQDNEWEWSHLPLLSNCWDKKSSSLLGGLCQL